MTDVTISLRVDKQLHNEMKSHHHINWSAVLRNSIQETIEKIDTIDRKRAETASEIIDAFRKRRIFASGKKGVEVIREWRDKR